MMETAEVAKLRKTVEKRKFDRVTSENIRGECEVQNVNDCIKMRQE